MIAMRRGRRALGEEETQRCTRLQAADPLILPARRNNPQPRGRARRFRRGPRGYHGAKKLTGRKRIALCDKGGNFLDALVMSADTGERVCALALLLQVKKQAFWRQVRVIFADSGFDEEKTSPQQDKLLKLLWFSHLQNYIHLANAAKTFQNAIFV